MNVSDNSVSQQQQAQCNVESTVDVCRNGIGGTYAWHNVCVTTRHKPSRRQRILQTSDDPPAQPKHILKDGRRIAVIHATLAVAVELGPVPVQGIGTKRGCEAAMHAARQHITVSLADPDTASVIVSGLVRPGELLAIMGASGAGKTTLLNVLTFRNLKSFSVSGSRVINSQFTNLGTIKEHGAYVQQENLLVGTLTVREHLTFQALLRMEPGTSKSERRRRVDEVIADLGLSKCADTMVGGTFSGISGISGGEAKRLSFACEVLTDPAFMFCDEPTSGLDSFMAQGVVQVLQELAQRGKTVICTIHQPSSEVFAMFDRLLLLAEGRTVFLGDATAATTFFKSNGHPCPDHFNPADFYILTLAVVPDKAEQSRDRIEQLTIAFQESETGKTLTRDTVRLCDISTADPDVRVPTPRSLYKTGWWGQFTAVFWRSLLSNFREPLVFGIKVFQTIFISVLFGVIYFGQELNQEGVMNLNGILFLLITNMTFTNIFSVIQVFTLEQPVFLREHANGMYRTSVYFLAKTLSELHILTVLPAVFVSICYFMAGLQNDVFVFFTCLGIVVLVANCAASFGYLVSCASGNITVALAAAAPAIIPLMLFGGYFLNSGTVPVYLIWLQYISWFNYANEALCVNQWQHVGPIACSHEPCFPMNGTTILNQLNFKPENFGRDIGALVALTFIFRLLAFLALLIRAYRASS